MPNLGLNGYERNTSDPSGRAGAAALVKIFDGAMSQMKESMIGVNDAVDAYIAPMAAKIKGEVDAAMKFMDDTGSFVGSKAIATLDASFAAQQFGQQGNSREVDVLTRIEQNGAKLLERMTFDGGIPVK